MESNNLDLIVKRTNYLSPLIIINMNKTSSIGKNKLSKLPVFYTSRKANMYIILQNYHKFYLKELQITINFLINFSSTSPRPKCLNSVI